MEDDGIPQFTASDQMVPMFRKTTGKTVMRGRPAYFNTVAARLSKRLAYSSLVGGSSAASPAGGPNQALAHGVIVACVLHNLVVNTDNKPFDDNEYYLWYVCMDVGW